MTRSNTINFSRKEVEYLKAKTGADDFNEALAILSNIVQQERVDPEKILIYVKKLMEKDGVK